MDNLVGTTFSKCTWVGLLVGWSSVGVDDVLEDLSEFVGTEVGRWNQIVILEPVYDGRNRRPGLDLAVTQRLLDVIEERRRHPPVTDQCRPRDVEVHHVHHVIDRLGLSNLYTTKVMSAKGQ